MKRSVGPTKISKKISWMLAVAFALHSGSGHAARFSGFDPGQKGLGLLVGQPTSLRFESWVDWKDAWFFDLGYHTGQQVWAGATYAFFAYDVTDHWKNSNVFNSILFYYGPGIFAGAVFDPNENANRVRLGGKFIGGFQYMFGSGKYAVRAEVGPALNALGSTALELVGGLGFTFYFSRDLHQDRVNLDVPDSLGGTGSSLLPTKKSGGDGEFDLSEDERGGKIPPVPKKVLTSPPKGKVVPPSKSTPPVKSIPNRASPNKIKNIEDEPL